MFKNENLPKIEFQRGFLIKSNKLTTLSFLFVLSPLHFLLRL